MSAATRAPARGAERVEGTGRQARAPVGGSGPGAVRLAMAERIEPDVRAILARRQIQNATRRVLASTRGRSLRGASSGSVSAAGPAEDLRAETRALARAAHRTLQGIGQGEAARQALTEVRASLGRLRELAVRGTGAPASTAGGATWSREVEGLAGATERLTGAAPMPGLEFAARGLEAATASLSTAGGAAAALGSLDAAFEALVRAEDLLSADRARAQERHASLERAERATLRAGAPPADEAAARELAEDVLGRLARAPQTLLGAAESTPPEVALELLSQGPVELPPLPSVVAPDAEHGA